jgi:hypothetical protein
MLGMHLHDIEDVTIRILDPKTMGLTLISVVLGIFLHVTL